MKPALKPPGTQRLKLKCDIQHSTSAFKFNLRRYSSGGGAGGAEGRHGAGAVGRRHRGGPGGGAPGGGDGNIVSAGPRPGGRGLRSSSSQLNLSHFCHSTHTP